MSVYAVNSKEPAFAWIPSLDDAGNGTTTLNDLIGSRDGTLTNMATPSSNWVADTGAGGIRRIDFDDTNDFATLGSGVILPSAGGLAISWWEKASTTTGNFRARFRFYTGSQGWVLFRSNIATYGTIAWGRDTVISALRSTPALSLASASGAWVNFVLVGNNGANSTTPADWTLYENGVSKTVDASNQLAGFTADQNQIGFDGLLAGAGCGMDDIRVFHQTLNASDASYLHYSGAGRGRVAVSGESRRRRQSVSGGVL